MSELLELEVGAVAHGGHCVARHEGRVVFVRHALPGEVVRARVTEGAEGARYWRADAVEVLRPSPDRVEPPCPWAGPGRCGGCDLQHVAPARQRALKAEVVAEQLRRLAGVETHVVVEPVGGTDVDDVAGLGWRTRLHLAVDGAGRAGLRAHRSHEVVPVDRCLIAHPRVADLQPWARRWTGASDVEVVAPADGTDLLVAVTPAERARRPRLPDLPDGTSVVLTQPAERLERAEDPGGRRERAAHRAPAAGVERVRGRTWVSQEVDLPAGRRRFRVSGTGFWQVHPGAAATLVGAVLSGLAPAEGERALDLYSGAGLFAAALADAVGPGGDVVAVEGDARAAADARRNLHDVPWVRVAQQPVGPSLAGCTAADVVVLDPPRTGARAAVVRAVVERTPRAVAYVACDPAALARDVATFATHGYRLSGLRAFDLFPQTHHVECVALLEPAA